jgi:hypothetical protein
LVAGPALWVYAVGWALVLEIAWLTALPSVLQFRIDAGVLVLSLIGHTTYGIVLGLLAQRCIDA